MGEINNKLIEFLRNHNDERLNKLNDTDLSYLIKFSDFYSAMEPDINSIEELIRKYDILLDPPNLMEYNPIILELVQSKFEAIKFKLYTTYTVYLSSIFFLIYPILINNYFYYFFILLMPISFMANSIIKIKQPIKKIFYFVLLILIITAIYNKNHEMIPVIVMFYLSKTLTQKGKENYRKLILNAALKSKLCFKFLFVIGLINIYNKVNNNFIKYKWD